MGHAVAGDAAGAFGGHQSVGAEAHQVLAYRSLRTAEAGGELRDVQWAVFEGLDDAEAVGMGKRPESSGTVTEDFRVKRLGFRHIQEIECVWAERQGRKKGNSGWRLAVGGWGGDDAVQKCKSERCSCAKVQK
jgi:hypothetical protein